ncbi:MAG: acetyl-CoA carboxylase biotin carboxyl carrier protein [Bacteroidetes bacterium]|nr:acetyl-CoA carboxylase biotin carboxyl carrier protein [Bacteroidia bacterium]MBN8696664.1 acetyl-CoA carboxylase biotin carboxyl carrier protein [Bacteroidota bacterium]MCC6837614.1 acetyl-CoA carboxylase biotin carboxyl carrier protein [Bacteroidia bacterium]MCK6649442.1 acetyl-CoA carboxylase biotin carboxyl carrier protein [Bacteroidia bacterium]
MKLNEIQDLIKFVSKSGVSEVELETKDVKIVIKTPAGKSKEQVVLQTVAAPVAQPVIQAAAPVVQQQAAPAVETKAPAANNNSGADESKYVTIKSPMIGTFYRSSSPDKPPFVNVGDEIGAGKTVCIIEAMKLFNEIESDVKGKIVKVLVNDATPVEYDQPLFLVDPS